MKRMMVLLAILSGCASLQKDAETFEAMKREIEAQRAKIIVGERELSRLRAIEDHKASVNDRQREIARIEALAQEVVPLKPRGTRGESIPDPTSTEAPPPPTTPSNPPAPPALPPPPGIGTPGIGMGQAIPPPIAPAIFHYPGSETGFTERPPEGWGPNVFSVLIENEATRWIEFGVARGHYCYLGIEVDGQPVTFVRPDRSRGAHPLRWHVKEGANFRTVSLIPPGKSAYVLLSEPGMHSWRWRCYEGPPRMVQTAAGMVPVLQFTEEGSDRALNRRQLRVTEGFLHPVVGTLE